jgi:PAS domain S-box-containing protein
MSSRAPREAGRSTVDFEKLFADLPTAYLVMTPDLVIVEANRAYLQTLGRTREELVGRPVFEAFPPTPDALDEHGRNPLQTSFERARDTGEPDPMPLYEYGVLDPVTGEVAQRYWSLISAPVLGEDGRALLVLQRVEDVTDYVREREALQDEVAREQVGHRRVEAVEADLFARVQELHAAQQARDVAARRLASLADVALELTAVESVEELERTVVAGLSVLGADGGALVSPADDEGGGWRITVSASLGERAQLDYSEAPHDSPLPACRSARTGQRVLLPTQEAGLALTPVMAEVYGATGRSAWACLPLVVRGERLGCLAPAWTEERGFRPDELELMDGFAAQCAQTLQRIRATAAQRRASLAAQRMSEALQRSLLTQPPPSPGLEIAVRYQPAAQEAQVGGDWHDAFVTAAGATILVVGDVSGHDRDAAAQMGQVRNLLRGLAYDSDDSPAVLLTRLDAALAGLHLETLATAVLARVEQGQTDRARGVRRLRWSNAGHPPPLLRRPDGSVVVLEAESDLLLGLDPTTPRAERVVELATGATLLLFTDGLVERRGTSLDDGIAHVAQELARHGALPPEDLCDHLLADPHLDGGEDDIALLVLRVGRSGAGAP